MQKQKKETATVLIVDDDPIVLKVTEEQISFYGYRCLAASSAERALLTAEKQEKIDLLLTDVMMPKMSGFDLARQFAALYPEIRVLFMSGYIAPSVANQGISETDHFLVEKPFDVDTLISKIRNILFGPAVLPIDIPGP